jgi:hypothetical protein
MRKQVTPLGICGIFLLAFQLNASMITNGDPVWYDPEDIGLEDNAYNTTEYFSLQWWYIDAIFDNNYSTHIGIMTIGAKSTYGFFLFQINIYKEGELLEKGFKFLPLRWIDTSQNDSILSFRGQEIVGTYLNDEQMVLTLSLELKEVATKLTFTGLVKGWKGHTGQGMYAVPLPRATARGTITIHNEVISVKGTGYQEHGWDARHLHRSWYWGKFGSASANIVFSQNMKNRWEEDIFLVVVNYNTTYISITRENIRFTHSEFIWNHGRRIPITSCFTVNQEELCINVEFRVQTIEFKTLLFLNYWRFHVHISGTITLEDVAEEIDDLQIMEILHLP